MSDCKLFGFQVPPDSLIRFRMVRGQTLPGPARRRGNVCRTLVAPRPRTRTHKETYIQLPRPESTKTANTVQCGAHMIQEGEDKGPHHTSRHITHKPQLLRRGDDLPVLSLRRLPRCTRVLPAWLPPIPQYLQLAAGLILICGTDQLSTWDILNQTWTPTHRPHTRPCGAGSWH